MLPLTIALTVLLSSLFPLITIIHGVSGVLIHQHVAHGWWGPIVYWSICYGPWLAISSYLLRRLKIASFAPQLSRGIRLAKIGLVIYAVYLVLVSADFVMRSIPYGGHSVFSILQLVAVFGRAFLFAGLALALVSELPAAERTAIHANRRSGI